MMRLDADPEKSRAIWRGLPRQPWAATGKPKPLASTLATIADSADGEANAVIVAQPYGLGKVLWIGTDGTWRWRYRVGDLHHHRFWGQVVRWANGAKLAVGNRAVRFGPTRPRLPEGESSSIRAQFADDAPGVGPDLLVAARVFKRGPDGKPSGEAVAVVPLRPRADQPRTFEAAAPALPPGSYLDPPRRPAARAPRPRPTSSPRSKSSPATPPSASSWPPTATRSTASPRPPAARSSRGRRRRPCPPS